MQALGWALRQARLDGTPIEAVIAWQYPIIYGWALPSIEEYDHRHIVHAMLNAVIADVARSDPIVAIHDRIVEATPSGCRSKRTATRSVSCSAVVVTAPVGRSVRS